MTAKPWKVKQWYLRSLLLDDMPEKTSGHIRAGG